MKKQLLVIGIIVLLIAVGLSGCNQISNTLDTEKSKFVGTWKTSDINATWLLGTTLVFFSDGTTSLSIAQAQYEIKDGKLVITVNANGGTLQYLFDYSFSNSNTILTLTLISGIGTGLPVVYTKQ